MLLDGAGGHPELQGYCSPSPSDRGRKCSGKRLLDGGISALLCDLPGRQHPHLASGTDGVLLRSSGPPPSLAHRVRTWLERMQGPLAFGYNTTLVPGCDHYWKQKQQIKTKATKNCPHRKCVSTSLYWPVQFSHKAPGTLDVC